MTRRVLVMRGGALGDFVLGLPALSALRDAYPSARLELIAPAAALPLAERLVDLATPIERAENAAFFGSGDLPEGLAERHRDLDLAVLWLADPEGTIRRHFETLGARRILQAPALPPKDAPIHATDHLLSTLEQLGISPGNLLLPLGASPISPLPPGETPHKSPLPLGEGQGEGRPLPGARASRPSPGGGVQAPALSHAGSAGVSPATATVRPSSEALERAKYLLSRLALFPSHRLLAIQPGSGGRRKCWPAQRFAEVAEAMARRGFAPVLLQGPADEEVVAGVQAALRGGALPVLSGLRVDDLAAILSLCHAYLGNDSGVTHLAAASGVPTVALFGPTDPAVWGPRGRRVTIIRGTGGSLEAITVEQVVDALLHHDAAG